MNGDEIVIQQNSRSVANRPLPSIPSEFLDRKDVGTILLFYQYKEPAWDTNQHKSMLKKVIEIADRNHVKGRGRVAAEGLNCTLSGSASGIREFCAELRRLDPALFRETDFKLTDGVPQNKLFKSLSIRKTKELVAYGLAGDDKAPSLTKFAGEHLEAVDYHKKMSDKDTVIIDVRNHYESALGSFQPPPDGAELINPKMRNSIEFPKWLAANQKKLDGKQVLMFCTGGIRCERATALLNQITAVDSSQCKPKGVYELRGGIERYVKTFPEGGHWRGKNYLFDRRAEQAPANKSIEEVEAETDSICCVCERKWTVYRGKFQCSSGLCHVPVIVCDSCKTRAKNEPKSLLCDLCKEGYRAPTLVPDLVGLKRKAEEMTSKAAETEKPLPLAKKSRTDGGSSKQGYKVQDEVVCKDRLFIARLPLTVTKTKLSEALGAKILNIQWLVDMKTNAFYGSCIVQLESAEVATKAVEKPTAIRIDKKKMRVSFARAKAGETWPLTSHEDREYPPIGYS